ncbi:hypothetical protein EIN_226450 [Entamoeba invadens IP1]|uniref:Methyltransferase domain-containing protein n=1 Tax=Entamoeba invadens IP1 TaxID=370355 RepID=A0A0A1U2I4_ENTIV|nr:hypothetical protein EIN_226450 [Entamoeba invadens IP1]ELP88272.1 hypothetical protein EIN_226450 [Entamoeba invadens IP1]|eukprot:XP_004255043.1 hypothetical protein EIN_226450 [Entamoeba invadens IP1]
MEFEGLSIFDHFEFHDEEYIVQRKGESEYKVVIKTLSKDTRQLDDCLGRTLWDGEKYLGDYLMQENVTNKRILEVGAGVGYASFCCRGAKEVIMSDFRDNILKVQCENIEMNKNVIQNVFSQKIDWNNPVDIGEFDLIVGSEIIYDKTIVKPLFNTIQKYLKKDGKCIIFNQIGRFLNCETQFNEEVSKNNFCVDVKTFGDVSSVLSSYKRFTLTKP